MLEYPRPRVGHSLKPGIGLSAVLLLVCAAGPAAAATVSSDAGVLTISDTQSERNLVYLAPPAYGTPATEQVIVRSADEQLSGGTGCTEASPEQATYKKEFHCTRGEHMTLDVHLGGGDDDFFGYPGVPYDSGTIDGGTGHDRLETVSGAPGEFIGGDGVDFVGYGYTYVGITATLDGQPNDGAPGESDHIHIDVEALNGGVGDDHLYGSDGRNSIYGGLGNDVIEGGAGDDSLSGDDGEDQIYGGAGQDDLYSAEWPQYQSPDTVDCGDGFDYLRLDVLDTQTGCENGGYPMGGGNGWSAQAPPGTPRPGWMPTFPPEPLPPMPNIATSGTVDPKLSAARIVARCPANRPKACRGLLALEAKGGADKGRVLGRGGFNLAKGSKVKLRIRLTRYGRRALRRNRSLKAAAVVTPRGGKSSRRGTVTLRVAGAK